MHESQTDSERLPTKDDFDERLKNLTEMLTDMLSKALTKSKQVEL